MLSKAILSTVLQLPSARRAAEKARPHQLSLGCPRGIEKLIHTCRAAFEARYIIGRSDFENGFNSLSRQQMLDNHAAVYPEATGIFNFLYGVDAPVFLIDDKERITVVWSSEGPRQGCAAGTHLFGTGVIPLLNKLQSNYPEFVLLVLTDDINMPE